MKLRHPMLLKIAGLLIASLSRLWRSTVDWRAVYCDPTVDTVHPRHQGRFVFVGWHEYMVMPLLLRGGRRMLALASEHADGEVVAQAIERLGWGVARGSTTRGGVGALLRLLRDDTRHLNITPDGPKGPRRTMTLSPIFLASKLGLPLVCVGYAYDRPWRARSWDRFAVVRPASRARAVFGPPLRVPAGLERSELETYRAWFEQFLNWLTVEAENWAEGGHRLAGEMPMLPAVPAPPMRLDRHRAEMRLPAAWSASWSALPRQSAARQAPPGNAA